MINKFDVQEFRSECGKIRVYTENVKLSCLIDFLLELKGCCIDILKNSHEEEVFNKKQWDEAENKVEDEAV